ncbi:hypothetical protein, partial [Escherichia coli]|uniref:hypothetical protein n=1 Tax=Escherichia coli TaxID=562 RepID=UPI001BC8E6FE
SGPKTSIICSPMTSLKTSIKTITYLSDTGCLEIQGASLDNHWMAQSIFANDNHSHYVLYVDSKVSLSAEALLAA